MGKIEQFIEKRKKLKEYIVNKKEGKNISDEEMAKIAEFHLEEARSETANGIMMCSVAIAKGIILDFLNKMMDNKDVDNATYNKYRDLIIEEMTPDKTQSYIMTQYVDAEKIYKNANAK